LVAEGAAGGGGEAVPFFEGKAAFFANRRGNLELKLLARCPGDMGEVVQHLFFREGELLGDFQGGEGLLQEKFFDSLAGG
jgi:hypothetical protein